MSIECNDGKKAKYVCMTCGLVSKRCEGHIIIDLNQPIISFYNLLQTDEELKISLSIINSFAEYMNNECAKKRNMIVKKMVENKVKIREGKYSNIKSLDFESIQSLIEKKIKSDVVMLYKKSNDYLAELSKALI
jgi:hypothetical protein